MECGKGTFRQHRLSGVGQLLQRFVAAQDEMLSSTRKGRAVLNVDAPASASLVTPADGDHVAIIGDNRKLLIFPLAQAPEMARGKGVRLQRYKDGGLADGSPTMLSSEPSDPCRRAR